MNDPTCADVCLEDGYVVNATSVAPTLPPGKCSIQERHEKKSEYENVIAVIIYIS